MSDTPDDELPRGIVFTICDPDTKLFSGFSIYLGDEAGASVFILRDGTLAPRGSRIQGEFQTLSVASSQEALRTLSRVMHSFHNAARHGGQVQVNTSVRTPYHREPFDPNHINDEDIPA